MKISNAIDRVVTILEEEYKSNPFNPFGDLEEQVIEDIYSYVINIPRETLQDLLIKYEDEEDLIKAKREWLTDNLEIVDDKLNKGEI